MLTVLDLFSGIGGFSLGLERTKGFKTIAFCERDEFCKSILQHHWATVPIYDDVTTLDITTIDKPNVITAGFPCQPWSSAGLKKGELDERNLWPQTINIIERLQPDWVILENVRRLVSQPYFYFQILPDLYRAGYDAEWAIIPASAMGFPHKRDRLWIVAYPISQRRGKEIKIFTHKPSQSREAFGWIFKEHPPSNGTPFWPLPNTDVLCGVDGLPTHMGILGRYRESIKAYGNSVIPAIPEWIGYQILNTYRNEE